MQTSKQNTKLPLKRMCTPTITPRQGDARGNYGGGNYGELVPFKPPERITPSNYTP